MRTTLYISLWLVTSAAICGQQVGDSNRNYGISSQGFGRPSPVQSVIVDCNQCSTWLNEYVTNDPDSPIIWATASGIQVGWSTTSTNSIDIGPTNLTFLLDGTASGSSLAPFMRTDSNGVFRLALPSVPSLQTANVFLAMAHVSPTSPDGIWVSQAHDLVFDPENSLGTSAYTAPPSSASNLNLLDNGSSLRNIGFSFPYFGGSFTQVYVNANGNLTFQAPSPDPTESALELTQGSRRIAPWWDDLDPSAFGAVRAQASTQGTTQEFTVWYDNVPGKGSSNTNRFSVTLRRSAGGFIAYTIVINYERVTGEGLVGFGRGLNLFSTPPVALDMSQAPFSGLNTGTSYYELFQTNGNPVDVYGHQIRLLVNAITGEPVVIN